MQTTAPTLTTDRLLIEPLAMKHWQAYAAAWADPRMTQFISPEPRSRNESWLKFTSAAGLWPLLGYGYWAFCNASTGALIGIGGLAQFERGIAGLEGHIEAGWAILPDAWDRGYATEAMAAIFAWADSRLSCTEIRCIIDINNGASMRVGKKLGFQMIGTSEGTTGPLGLFSRKQS
ncbi:MAG: GNAT family N-acetyltransferase [Sphingorhabdus sp.]